MIYGALSRDPSDGQLSEEYEKQGMVETELQQPTHPAHYDIAGLLGYPTCCKDSFYELWVQRQVIDTTFHQAWATSGRRDIALHDQDQRTFPVIPVHVKGHSSTVQHLRYLGVRITPHLCCSYTCKDTIHWASQWLDVMRELDSEATEDLVRLCQMPVKWTAFKGVGTIDTPIFHGAFNTLPAFPDLQVYFESENEDALKDFPAMAKGSGFPFEPWGTEHHRQYLQPTPSAQDVKMSDLRKSVAPPVEYSVERVDA